MKLSFLYASLILLYIVNVPLTYGYTYNKVYHKHSEHRRQMDAISSSIIWPIYWPFKLSELVFSEEVPEKVKEPEKYYYNFR